MSNIKPLYDRVVIKRTEEEKVSAGGIVIPEARHRSPFFCADATRSIPP